MRALFVVFHRCAGLAIAGFLFVSGLTGAVISWDHELDHWINAHLTRVESRGPAVASLDLAKSIEAGDPRVRVTFVPMTAEEGEALAFGVQPRRDPTTGLLYEPGYNEVFVDPATGVETGRRDWGAAWPLTRETFVSFLYVLHYSLHIPAWGGIDRWGRWLLGVVAIVWLLDSFVGFYLTLPAKRPYRTDRAPSVQRQLARGWWDRWKPAWRIKRKGSAYRITFDIHRAFGLWTWGLVFILAFTAFSLNLYREVFYPVMAMVSETTPTPFDVRTPTDKHRPLDPALGYLEILDKARAEAAQRGWDEPVGSLFYAQNFGVYGASFHHPGEDHGAAGVGPRTLYFDATDGSIIGARLPWQGTLADIFLQAQFPLHSGRILGLPGRILVSITGIVVAALSLSGVAIWYRKHRVRIRVRKE